MILPRFGKLYRILVVVAERMRACVCPLARESASDSFEQTFTDDGIESPVTCRAPLRSQMTDSSKNHVRATCAEQGESVLCTSVGLRKSSQTQKERTLLAASASGITQSPIAR